MSDFLKQIKLVEDIRIDIPISKTEFVTKLSNVTLPNNTLIEIIGNSDKLFIGEIEFDVFVLRPKKRFGQNNYGAFTKLKADFSGNSQKTSISGQISLRGFYPIYMMSMGLLFFVFVLLNSGFDDPIALVFISFMILSSFGMTYFILRKAVKNSKEYFERELFFLSKE